MVGNFLENILAKRKRLLKLLNAPTLKFTGNEYKEKYELNAKSAQSYLKHNQREHTIKDTNENVRVSKRGSEKVTSHDRYNEIHLKSIAFVPELIENSIFIDESISRESRSTYDKYRYYVTGLEINGEPYTAKIVIGVKGNLLYYDHYLTKIKKDTLLKNGLDKAGEQYALDIKDTTLLKVVNSLPLDCLRKADLLI